MDTLMKADIFFFVTTIAVIAFTLLWVIALAYLISILRDIKKASRKLQSELDAIGRDADTLYHKISESFIFNMLFGKRAKKK